MRNPYQCAGYCTRSTWQHYRPMSTHTFCLYGDRLYFVQLLATASLCQRVSTKISEAIIGAIVHIKTEPLEGPAMQDHIDRVSAVT